MLLTTTETSCLRQTFSEQIKTYTIIVLTIRECSSSNQKQEGLNLQDKYKFYIILRTICSIYQNKILSSLMSTIQEK